MPIFDLPRVIDPPAPFTDRIKMVYVGKNICYFLRKGMDEYNLKHLCAAGVNIVELILIFKNFKQKTSPLVDFFQSLH